MDDVKLVATAALKYRGKAYVAGDTFVARRAHAKAFKALNRATDAPAEVPASTPAAAAPEPAPAPATYDTKHMEAETPGAPASDPKAKRTYQRRDVTRKP